METVTRIAVTGQDITNLCAEFDQLLVDFIYDLGPNFKGQGRGNVTLRRIENDGHMSIRNSVNQEIWRTNDTTWLKRPIFISKRYTNGVLDVILIEEFASQDVARGKVVSEAKAIFGFCLKIA